MANYPGSQQNGQFLPSPTSPYSPRTPPPQRTNIPPAANYVPPSNSPYPVGGFQNTLTTVGKDVLKGLTKVGTKALNKVLDHPTLVNIKSGNVVQFVSRITGQSLQILQAPDGRLVLDSLGGDGHQFHNAHFTVLQDKDGYIMFHNNFNYLAIRDGIAQLYAAGSGSLPTPECRFKVREVLMQNQFVTIESVSERGRYVAVLPNGQMKSAIATTGADQDTHFAVRLIVLALLIILALILVGLLLWYIRNCRREPRYDYTALADESFLTERLEMDRKLIRDSDRNMATICCQYYLRGSSRYAFLQHLPDMGSRVGKNWYLVRDGATRTERLLTMTPLSPEGCPVRCSSPGARQVLLELFLALQHPYIYPVLDIDRKVIMEQEYVVAVMPFNEEGALKDIIYQSHCQDEWKDKYHYHGYGLICSQIQRLGCQILEALLFLKDQKFPPFLHLHSGNVIVQNGVARIAGLENTLFGYSSRLQTLVPKRLQDYKESIEVISFGHLMFEMAAGYELTACQPSEKNFKDIEHLPLVMDVLKFIFEQVRHRHPSLRQIASLEFFRHIDLRELRSLMPVTSIKARLSTAALSLLKDVKRSQRSKRRGQSTQSVHSVETASQSSRLSNSSEGSSKRSSKRRKKSRLETGPSVHEQTDPGQLLKTLPLSEVETSDTSAMPPDVRQRVENPNPEWSLLLLDIQRGIKLKKTDPMV